MTLKRLYATIQKVEEQPDGTLRVEGIASSEAVDADGEVIRADAIRAALPDYMAFGALREMHQPLAAGKTLEAEVGDDGVTRIAAKVVDPVAITKVREGVYQGFSIGGKVLKRSGPDLKTIEALKLVEISLVDRPANPDALLSLFKAEELHMHETEGTASPAAEETAKAATPAAAPPPEGTQTAPVTEASAPKADAAPAIVEKKGAKFSADTRAQLAEIHKCVKAAHDGLEALKYRSPDGLDMKDDDGGDDGDAVAAAAKDDGDSDGDDDAVASAAKSGSLVKSQLASLEKRAKDAEELLAKATEVLKTVVAERDELRLKIAQRKPLRAVAVEKSEDGATTTKAEETPPPEGTQARVLWELKKVHASGPSRLV